MKPHEIKSLRKHMNMNADQFAASMGLTGKHRARTVFAWEKGTLRPAFKRVGIMHMAWKAMQNER